MIVNGFLHFYISKPIQLVWKILHKLVIKIDIYAQKVKCFVCVEKNIQVVKLDRLF